jgi:prepilin-type N-terminal cleavage/methylation domain-containing protein
VNRRRESGGFTLIELLAVVLIFLLVAGIALPNMGILSSQASEAAARELAATTEFARQRALVTALPHRVAIDLDEGSYWIEWYVTDARAAGEAEPPPVTSWSDLSSPPTSPPRAQASRYRPINSPIGKVRRLGSRVFVERVETAAGEFREGEVHIAFERDGLVDATVVWLEGEAGDLRSLTVDPLGGSVRIARAE